MACLFAQLTQKATLFFRPSSGSGMYIKGLTLEVEDDSRIAVLQLEYESVFEVVLSTS